MLENIGMCCGLMPITGIPLPFMSYGTSFMVVNFTLLGLIGSVWAHSGRWEDARMNAPIDVKEAVKTIVDVEAARNMPVHVIVMVDPSAPKT